MGAPDIQRAFGLTHASTTLVIFVVPAIVGFIVDPIVFLYSDRHPRKWFVAGGLGVMAAAAFSAALAPNAAMLAGAIACWYVAAGASAALSLGASPGWQSAILAGLVIGGIAGLAVLDRLLVRVTETTLLIACGLSCTVAYVAWLAAPSLLASALLIVPVGATSATLYPLASARAYARCPGRSGVVLAGGHLFTPVGLTLPWLLGIVADRAGTLAALALLVVQPLGLALLAYASRGEQPYPLDRDGGR